MIPSAKSRWFTAWFAGHARARIQRRFGALALAGGDHLRAALIEGPVLAVSNHSAWWDPLVTLTLANHLVPADLFAMMDAANLDRLPFFAKVGAFGVERGSITDGARALRYAEQLLDRPGRLVWIFAQGQERPLHERPLQFRGGTGRLAVRNAGLTVLPVAIAYAFEAEEAPVVYVAVGAPVSAEGTASAARAQQQVAVTEQLVRIQREQAYPNTEGFERLLQRQPGWLAGVAEGALARLARPFVPGLEAFERSPSRALQGSSGAESE